MNYTEEILLPTLPDIERQKLVTECLPNRQDSVFHFHSGDTLLKGEWFGTNYRNQLDRPHV